MKKLKTLILIFVFTLVMTGCQSEEMKTAVAEFDSAVLDAEQKNSELEEAISAAAALIAQDNPVLDTEHIPKLETAISECKAAKKSIPEMPKQLEEIEALSAELNAIDYSAVLEDLSAKQSALEESIKRCALVTAPSEGYIIDCLKKVPNIVDIAAVTEENDPNGHLNKQGGYTAFVYFSSDLIDQSEFDEVSVIEKGSQCGGAIEVYSCIEDVTRRNDYLATFDGGVLASGSHAIVGTVLVRTSDKLTATKQKTMESSIIAVLTYLEGDILDLPEQEPIVKAQNNSEPEPDNNGSDTTTEVETSAPKPVAPPTPSRKDVATQRAKELALEYIGASRAWIKEWLMKVELFSEEEAQYALINSQIDWESEAIEDVNAMGHVNGSSMGEWTTPNDVIRELRSRGFTNDEISNALVYCNFDWLSEASTLARIAGTWQEFNGVRTYTFDEVVAFLQSVGFTEDAALIGATLSGIDWSSR